MAGKKSLRMKKTKMRLKMKNRRQKTFLFHLIRLTFLYASQLLFTVSHNALTISGLSLLTRSKLFGNTTSLSSGRHSVNNIRVDAILKIFSILRVQCTFIATM